MKLKTELIDQDLNTVATKEINLGFDPKDIQEISFKETVNFLSGVESHTTMAEMVSVAIDIAMMIPGIDTSSQALALISKQMGHLKEMAVVMDRIMAVDPVGGAKTILNILDGPLGFNIRHEVEN